MLAQRQDNLEQGMGRLATAAEALSTQVAGQSSMLQQANNMTSDILDALEETAAMASWMSQSFFMSATAKSWWPLVVFPTAALVMGSYGLPPSILRNIGLLAFGEAVGLVVSSYDQLTTHFFGMLETTANTTASAL